MENMDTDVRVERVNLSCLCDSLDSSVHSG